MFITGNKEAGFNIHFNLVDQKEAPIETGGNVLVLLSADKAKELEDKLEEALKED